MIDITPNTTITELKYMISTYISQVPMNIYSGIIISK